MLITIATCMHVFVIIIDEKLFVYTTNCFEDYIAMLAAVGDLGEAIAPPPLQPHGIQKSQCKDTNVLKHINSCIKYLIITCTLFTKYNDPYLGEHAVNIKIR